MPHVLTTSPGFGRHPTLAARMEAAGWTFERQTEGDLSAGLSRADFLVAGLPVVDAATLALAPKLKAVLKHGVGVDNIDIPACTAAGIPVMNAPGGNANAVAELTIGLMFAAARRIGDAHLCVTSGRWERPVGVELHGRVLGIIGLGNIGKRVALLAQALGMVVVANDLVPDTAFMAQHGIVHLDKDRLLASSDVLSLHVDGGAANAGLIGAERIARMKPGALLLNLARGEVLDLAAVAEALHAGHLRGAAIDAYVPEPPDMDHPIFKAPGVTFTPHAGSDTVDAIENVGRMVIEDIETLLAGNRPARALNPEVFG